jgi:hypothetical protein
MSFYLHLKNWPIMIKISAALLGASLIPVIFVAFYGFTSSVATIEKTEYYNLELLAGATAERLDQLMIDNLVAATQLSSDNEIIALVSDPANVSESVRASVSSSLTRILVTNPQYEYVYLMDKNGKVIMSKQLSSTPSVEGKDFSTRAYYLEAMKGKSYIDVLVGGVSNKLGFYFSAPVLGDDGKPVGVAIVKLKGEAITDIINKLKPGNTGYAFLVDQDGVVVSHPNPNWFYHSLIPLTRDAELRVGQRFRLSGCEDPKNLTNCKVQSLNLSPLASVVGGSDEVRHVTYRLPSDGSERIVGIANTSTQLNWSVGVDEAKDDFIAPLKQLARQTFLIVFVIGILAVIGGIILARLITHPLGKLSLAAQAVEQGGTLQSEGFASVMRRGDEVGRLAVVFNNMVKALDARVSELNTLNVVTRTISSSYNIGNTLALVLNSLRNVVPYDRALVLLYDPQKDEFYTRATADGRGFYLNRVWSQYDRPAIHTRDENHIQQFFDKRQLASKLTMGRDQTIGIMISDIDLVPDTELDYTREWPDFEPKSYLGVPLLFKEDIVGVIEFASAHTGCFTTDHEHFLRLIAGQAGVAVHNALDVEMRETELRKQIDELQMQIVIDEGKKQKNVNEIIESDFFQELTSKAMKIRQKRHGSSDSGDK